MDDLQNRPDAGAFALEKFLPYRLSLLSNTVSEGIARTYRKEHGLSVTEWRVIAVLGRFPGQTASQVMRRTAMDKVSISRAVRRLLDRGLIERAPLAQDRRCQALRLTPHRGRALFVSIVPKALQFEARLIASLTGAERRQLDDLLAKLQAAAEHLAPTSARDAT